MEREKLTEAVHILNNILGNGDLLTTMSQQLNQTEQTSNSEMQRLFRGGTSANTGFSASASASTSSMAMESRGPRYQTRQNFGGWTSSSRKR